MVLFLLNLFLLNLPGLTGSHLLVSCYKEITIDTFDDKPRCSSLENQSRKPEGLVAQCLRAIYK